MKTRKDPTLDALRGANPTPQGSTTGWHASAEGRGVAARVRAAASQQPEAEALLRSRGPRVAVTLVAAVAALALGASLAVVSMPSVTPNATTCFAKLDQHASRSLVALRQQDPIDACVAQWAHDFGVAAPPRLTACVLDGGGSGVFPYPDAMTPTEACLSVGAAVLEPGSRSP